MQANVHTPQRLTGESQAEYKLRRAASKATNRTLTCHGHNGGVNSRAQHRDSMRKSGTMGKRTRAYVALMASWAEKRITKTARSDENGSFTLTGRNQFFPDAVINGIQISQKLIPCPGRRMWLAGISAQRGY